MKRAQELVEFIQKNRLELLEMENVFSDRIIFEFRFDRDHLIEYCFEFDSNNTIYDVYYNHETGDWDYTSELTSEDALRMRGEHAVKAVSDINKGDKDES